MLHLRRLDLLETKALTVSGQTIGQMLDEWGKSERRENFRKILQEADGVDADDVILPPEKAAMRGLTSTLAFPRAEIWLRTGLW